MKKFDLSISVCRIAATIFIVCCHLFSKLGVDALAQVFNVGVPMFLVLSGVLYGRGTANYRKKGFLIKAWCKNCIPVYLWLIVVVYAHCLNHNFEVIKTIPTFLLDIQGLGWIIDGVKLPIIGDMGVLWFFTVIMICYALLPLMEKMFVISKHPILMATLMYISTLVFTLTKIDLSWFAIFYLGYVLGSRNISANKFSHFMVSLASAICSMSLRLVGKKYFDDTFFYDNVIANVTHLLLALGLIGMLIYFSKKIDKLIEGFRVPIVFMDRLSMYIYIVHYTMLSGVLAADRISDNNIMWIIMFLIMTFVFASALKIVGEKAVEFALTSIKNRGVANGL